MMLLAQCTTSCGYAAAFVSCLSFGSFALPMKGKAAKECDVHPLVFQTYKTVMCFLSSFSVLFLGVDKLTFSPWGIVSGLFWVPAGITYVCGIRTAGLAICHGTAASVIVMVSFSWGIFVFHERVRSLASALFAILLMICGIFGMSFASAPPKKGAKGADGPVFARADSKSASDAIFCFRSGCFGDRVLTWTERRQNRRQIELEADDDDNDDDDDDDNDHRSCSSSTATARLSNNKRSRDGLIRLERLDGDKPDDTLPLLAEETQGPAAPIYRQEKLRVSPPQTRAAPRRSNSMPLSISSAPPQSVHSPIASRCAPGGSPPAVQSRNVSRPDSQSEENSMKGNRIIDLESNMDSKRLDPSGKEKWHKSSNGGAEAIVKGMCRYIKVHYGITISTRQMGLMVAGFGSIWGGSVMVPLHFAGESAQGLGFVFSFAIGATLVNGLIWILCFFDALRRHGCDCGAAIHSLPPLHLRKLIFPGVVSGTLWSIGNMASMISVTFLGEGVGYSMTQSAMLVSGLWGIFLFKEITNPAAIRGWLASACLTITGILLLSYNHLPPNAPAVLLQKKNL